VEGLGARVPWTPRPTKPGMTLFQQLVSSSVHKMCGKALTKGSVRMIMPNGSEVVYGDPRDGAALDDARKAVRGADGAPLHSRVRVYDMKLFERIAKDTDIGLGEAFMHGDFEPDDLTAFLGVLTQNVASVNRAQSEMGIVNWVGTKLQTLAHMARANTVEGSRANINEVSALLKELHFFVRLPPSCSSLSHTHVHAHALSLSHTDTAADTKTHTDRPAYPPACTRSTTTSATTCTAFSSMRRGCTPRASSTPRPTPSTRWVPAPLRDPVDSLSRQSLFALRRAAPRALQLRPRSRHCAQSQLNKLDLIIDKLQLSPESHILEIGCGSGVMPSFVGLPSARAARALPS